MKPTLFVSAGILLRTRNNQSEYMLACRPMDKVYGGFWEFPGGKIEEGESALEALTRELTEELKITVTSAEAWKTVSHDYPHAKVCLNFFRVHAWTGEICPQEHSAIAWIPFNEAPKVEPSDE